MPKPPLSPDLFAADARPSDRKTGAGRRGAMDLDAGELLVVATLRAWVAPHTRPGEAAPDWRDIFRLAEAGAPAMIAFDALMSVVASQAKRAIDVHCCCCPALGADEVGMLRLVGALQSGETLEALSILEDWLPGDAMGPALRAARRFAFSIAEAGLSLPRRGQVIAFPADRTLH